MIESLDVILWDKKVGTLVANREGHRSKACFYFDSDYVRDGYDIAPLRAPVKGVAAQRGLPVYPDEERLFGGLPSFIADSLPDHWGNTVFNEWGQSASYPYEGLVRPRPSRLYRTARHGGIGVRPAHCRGTGDTVQGGDR